MSDDFLDDDFFAPEANESDDSPDEDAWNVIIVDDEPAVHEVTTIALSGFSYDDRKINYLHAYSAEEAKSLFKQTESPIAVALVDVVMETEHAGLDLVSWIRNVHGDEVVRLILRTGQPGQAPEKKVITDYDINDYKAKTELTSQRLYTLMYTALRSYELISRLDASKRGVEKVISATRKIMQHRGFLSFIEASLEQLTMLLGVHNSVLVRQGRIAVDYHDGDFELLSCNGVLCAEAEQATAVDELPFADMAMEALQRGESIYRDNEVLALIQDDDHNIIFYLQDIPHMDDLEKNLVQLFAENVSIALKNLHAQLALTESQHEIIHRLTETVEKRSKETGHHVRRVSEGCALIAREFGLSNEDVELIRLASPLHDIGKVAIPDDVLQKPGKLDALEWEVMKTHAQRGYEILSTSNQPLLQAGADIAHYHHEKWNGEGYPEGLAGEDIPIFARICALIDVFDALLSERVYKDPWPLDKVLDLLAEERGKSFDPKLVDLLVNNLDAMQAIRDSYPD